MSVKINFNQKAELFPSSSGYWIRLVFHGNSIVQGHVMLFDPANDHVVLMDSGQTSKPEVIRQGDELNVKDGRIVTYTKVDSVTVPAKTAKPSIIGGD